jgi:hypothetical protein
MTTNQIVAMLFPLLGVVAVGAVGLLVRRPWNEKKKTPVPPNDLAQALHQAGRIIRTVEGQMISRSSKVLTSPTGPSDYQRRS